MEQHIKLQVTLSTESTITEEQVVVKIMEALHSDANNDHIIICPVNEPAATPPVNGEALAEELWDKYSYHVDDDIDSLQMVAGSSVLRETGYKKLITELLAATPQPAPPIPQYKKTIDQLSGREKEFFALLKYILHDEELALGYVGAFEDVVKEQPAPAGNAEGPWKYEVHHSQGPEDCEEWVTITDGKVVLRLEQHEDEEGEQKIVNLLNAMKATIWYENPDAIIASYYKEQNEELKAAGNAGSLWKSVDQDVDGWKLCRVKGTTEQMPLMIAPNVIVDFAGKTYKREELEYVGQSGAVKEAEPAVDPATEAKEVERRNKIIEDSLKLSMRLYMPGISEQEQEATWQKYKEQNNL